MPKRLSEEDNFAFLTVALVLLLLTAAIVDQFASNLGKRLVPAVTVVTLAIAVWGVKHSGIWFRTGIGMVIAIFLVALGGQFLDQTGLHYAHLLILLVFFSYTAWLAMRQVLFTGAITRNKIFGAVCIYLLLGLIFAMLYLLIVQFSPSAFNGVDKLSWYDNLADYVYFSFVSLTTLGFGDITPALPVVRFLVYMEAVVGQLYVAILIASLVGMRISARTTEKSEAVKKQNSR
jgi:hypothetical protein